MFPTVEIRLVCLHIIVLSFVGIALYVWWMIKDLQEELKQKRERLEWFVDIMEHTEANMPEGYRFGTTLNKKCQVTYYLMRDSD